MRAACCEATVLRNEVIAPDIRLLTVVWPDRDHAPHAGQFFTLRSWGADEAPFLSRPISVHRSSSRIPSSSPAPWATALTCRRS